MTHSPTTIRDTARTIRDADPSLNDHAIAFLTAIALVDPDADPVSIPATLVDDVYYAALAGAYIAGLVDPDARAIASSIDRALDRA